MPSITLLLALSGAHAATFTVDATTTAAEVQAFIDGAAVNSPHTITFNASILGSIDVSRLQGGLTLVGNGGGITGIVATNAGEITIDALAFDNLSAVGADITMLEPFVDGGVGPLIDIAGGTLSVIGGTISNGNNIVDPSLAGYVQGAGVRLENVDATFDGVELSGNVTFGNGGAIYATGGSLHVLDSTFSNNSAGELDFFFRGFFGSTGAIGRGGSVYTLNADVVIERSTFEDSLADEGGGLYAQGGTLALGTASVANGNPREWTLNGNLFLGGHAVRGGGAYINDVEEIGIYGNNFAYNTGNDYRGYSDVEEAYSGIADLTNGSGEGAGFYVIGGGEDGAIIKFNEVGGNIGWDSAGAHIEDVDELVITNNLVAQNWAVHHGGGLNVIIRDDTLERPVVTNNTLVGNTSGLTLLEFIVVVGAGGNARFDGVIPDFRNNIVAYAFYGGGVLGVDNNSGPFEQGDEYNDYFRYNMFYQNCDVKACTPLSFGDKPTTGNFAAYALHPTNLEGLDPNFIYFGDVRQGLIDRDPYPDVFCTRYDSQAVRGGDPDLPNDNPDPNSIASDIGYCGGPDGDYINRDRDQDGFEQYYDCLDEPGVETELGARAEDVYPGAYEACDLEDNDCDGEIDEGFVNTWYPDTDRDGFGASGVAGTVSCTAPGPDWSEFNTDCDDNDNSVFPTAQEACNLVDDNCDGSTNGVDEPGIQVITVYPDSDSDGYGNGGQGKQACEIEPGVYASVSDVAGIAGEAPEATQFVGHILNAFDCNDADPTINPGILTDDCDGNEVDADCDGLIDEDGEGTEYFTDNDQDGFGDDATRVSICDGLPPEGTASQGGDCDDTDFTVNPGVGETCDGRDNDCNNLIDDDPADQPVLYSDFDGDGFGNPATAVRVCEAPVGYVNLGGDCDDNDPTVGECSECGCQSTPTPGSLGATLVLLTGLLGLRRRR